MIRHAGATTPGDYYAFHVTIPKFHAPAIPHQYNAQKLHYGFVIKRC